jgi:hypothetical protein
VTCERTYHLVATITLVTAIVASGVCRVLEGTVFWAISGTAMVLLVVGVYFAGRASAAHRKRGEKSGRAQDK